MTTPQARESIAWRLARGELFEVLQELASAGGYMVCLCAGHPKPPPNGATVVPFERKTYYKLVYIVNILFLLF